MELFRLLGTVAIESSGANRAIDEVTDNAEKSQSKISSAFDKIGSAAVKMGKVAAAGFAAVQAGVAALAKEALEGYADYEQLIGGVETLFKDSADKVEEYANNAYKTAGLSANKYMETVTSFSASLLQSLGGDTEAAAEKADMAITDMSDNANKMGSSMESIQNAYQGFAKQNYTMLDNLKLGYGGTQQEMFRLMQDAAKLDATFAANAVFSLDSKGHLEASYADIVDAIHIVQTEMGITGTTAKEASSTIAGSVDSAKAAWHNLIAGLGKDGADLADLTNQFVNGVITAAENIIPRFVVIKDNIAKVAEDLFGKLFDHISIGILNTEVSFEEVSTKIKSVISDVKESAMSILQGGFEWIQTTAIPTISTIWQNIQAGFEIVKPVLEEAAGKIVELTERVIGVATEIFGTVSSKFGEVEGTFLSFVENVLKPLCEKYLNNLIAKFEALVEIWETILLPMIQMVVDAFLRIVTSIYKNVEPAIKKIMDKFNELASLVRKAIKEYIVPVIESFISMILELYEENKEKLELIGELFGAIFEWISDVVTRFVSWFKDTFIPFLEEIRNFVQENMDKIKGIFQNVINIITGIIQAFISLFKADWEGLWTAVKNTLESAFLAIRGIFELIGAAIGEKVLAIKEAVTGKFEEIKTNMSEKIQAAKDSVLEVFENLKSGVAEKITAVKDKVAEIFDNIKSTISSKIKSAKDVVEDVVDSIKGFFDFEVSLPKIKLPHFSIDPEGWKLGDLLEGVIPKLGIDWYAKGGVMEEPTVFGMNGSRLMAGGEAGPEAIAPIDVLQGYIAQAVAAQNTALVAVLQQILEAILAMDENMGGNLRDALEGTAFEMNHREFARLVKAVN